jgi:hypothetical protein
MADNKELNTNVTSPEAENGLPETVAKELQAELESIQADIDKRESTAHTTLPALSIGTVTDPEQQRKALEARAAILSGNPQPDDVMDAAGRTRQQMSDFYEKAVPFENAEENPLRKHQVTLETDENGLPMLIVSVEGVQDSEVMIAHPLAEQNVSTEETAHGPASAMTPISTQVGESVDREHELNSETPLDAPAAQPQYGKATANPTYPATSPSRVSGDEEPGK